MEPRNKSFFERITEPEPIRYDQQVIIDFIGDDVVSALKTQWDKRHPTTPCLIINGYQFLISSESCPLETKSRIRIYLNCHGNGQELSDINAEKIDDNQLVNKIAAYVGDKECVLNIIACGTARGHMNQPFVDNDKTIAAKIHKKLFKLTKRDIPVIGRTHSVAHSTKKSKTIPVRRTVSLDIPWKQEKDLKFKARQPGSKLIICNNQEGKQVIFDAYLCTWRNRVFKIMEEMIAREKNSFQKSNLTAGIKKFRTLRAEQIYESLVRIVKDPTSYINKGLFVSPTTKKLKKLITEWEKIQKSPHTMKKIVIS